MIQNIFSGDDISYKMINTERSESMLFKKYAYKLHSKTKLTYYCPWRRRGCKGRVKLSRDGIIKEFNENHIHPPPKYIISDGVYIEIKP